MQCLATQLPLSQGVLLLLALLVSMAVVLILFQDVSTSSTTHSGRLLEQLVWRAVKQHRQVLWQ
jgi:hypothetical protein